MTSISERIQRSFVEQFGRLTRSTTSLRARIRDRIGNLDTPNSITSTETKSAKIATRITRAPQGECIYAIGDIHGRFDLLERLIDQIREDAASLPEDTRCKIVFLGDYIDRGLQSRQVIDYFLSGELDDFETVFLMGNHEEALLRFLEEESFGKQWVRFGGAETFYSYGFQPPNTRSSLGNYEAMAQAQAEWTKLWEAFRRQLPENHLEFYRSLLPYHAEGDYLFVHAGLRPNVPLEQQTQRDLLWIREEFLDDPREFEHVIVHGHTPTEDIVRDDRRIGLDTGAFISGRLSAAKFIDDKVDFLST